MRYRYITGKDYSHRKEWFSERLALLAETFAIDICAYVIMSNHFHGVLKINAPVAQSWSDKKVTQQWEKLFKLPVLVERFLAGDCKSDAELDKARETIQVFRERLMDISWFMRCLNEYIARKANAEDKCTGRFWEGRFKSQALLDEQALIACLTYVDLNPVRAGISDSLENSEFTSIKQRIDQIQSKSKTPESAPRKLADFIGSFRTKEGIPFALSDYDVYVYGYTSAMVAGSKRMALELTDWTGQVSEMINEALLKQKRQKFLSNWA